MKKFLLFFTSLFFLVQTSLLAADYYWIGNSGTWSDASHWASSSGGSGGAGIPGSNDNVVFDQNSFNSYGQVVQVNGNVSCNDFSIKKNLPYPFNIQGANASQINVYGSFSARSSFTNEFQGTFHFREGKGMNSIETSYIPFSGDIKFSGNGEWKLFGPLMSPEGTVIFEEGNLDLNGFDLICYSFVSNKKNKRKIESQDAIIMVYNTWDVSETKKLKQDFDQTKILVGGKGIASILKGGLSYHIQEVTKSSGKNSKKTATVNIEDDTVSCGSACDGRLVAEVSTPCPGYEIYWLPSGQAGDSTDTIYNLCPNTYQAVVTDTCDGTTITEFADVFGHPQIVMLNQTINDATCKDSCDGDISILVSGASYANFTYNWSNGDSGSPSADSLCAGTHSVYVTDSYGCDTTFYFTVNEPDYIRANATTSNVSCNGFCDGTATANPTGGDGNYNYQWQPGGQNTPGISSLCPGNYTVQITDGNSCYGDTTITITEPTPLSIDTTHSNVTCGGACDGYVIVNPSGGTAPYTHSWNTGASTDSLGGLCPGTYVDTVRDANGCDTIITFNLTQPLPITLTSGKQDVLCKDSCDGVAWTVPAGGTPPYTYLWNDPNSQTTDTATGLCPGQYIVTVTDNYFCVEQDTVVITEPAYLVPNASGTDPSCNGVCDGSVTANPTGGTPPYSYSWLPGGQTSQSVNSLCAGTYTLTVTDSNGCIANDTVTITQPAAITASLSKTDMSCNAVCDGAAWVNSVSGGTPPYSYQWSTAPVQTTDSITGLCAGNYAVTITDANGCSVNRSITINEPATIQPNVTTTDADCNGACTGSATANPTGGTPGYTYSWNTSPVQTSQTATGLCAGSYQVTVTDANGCTGDTTITINEPTAISTTTNKNDVTCKNACNGFASVTPSGGTPSYTYSWSPGGQTTQSINNLCAGTYTVTVSDNNNCQVVDTVVITEPDSLLTNAVANDMSCNGVCDGSATAFPTGGTAPYSYTWAPGGQTTQTISNLCSGFYTVTVTDANNCTFTQTVQVQDPPVLSVNTTQQNASCGTVCDGIATASPNGGTPPYSYSWDDPNNQNTAQADSLCVGTYQVTVTDSNGCTASDTVQITELIKIFLSVDTVNVSCNGLCDGQATIDSVSGGTAPYTYQWDDSLNQTTQTADSLCPGSYNVTVTDANGCQSTASVSIPPDPAVLVPNGSATDVTCPGDCDGSVTSNPTGGTPPYSYLWQETGDTTASVSNLCAGTYTIQITDSNGCVITQPVNVNEPDSFALNESITHVDCFGNCNGSISLSPTGGTSPYSYSWSDGSTNKDRNNLCAGTYIVTLTDSLLCTFTDTFVVSSPAVLGANLIGNDISCKGACDGSAQAVPGGGTGPYTYFWSPTGDTTSTINNLCPGTYCVLITDSNGCSINRCITINEPNQLQLNVSKNNISCNGACDGNASANVSGGTTPYSYSWNTGDTTQNISNLCGGNYVVTVTDANGCSRTDSVTVIEPTPLVVSLDSTAVTCNGDCDGSAKANVSGGTTPYSYTWMPGGQTTPTISNLCPGNYSVTVTDSNGCFFQGSVQVDEPSVIDDNESITDPNCGFCDGVISLNPTGGVPPYSYNWNNGDTTQTVTGLCAGSYSVTITDFNGCNQSFNYNLSNPSGPVGEVITTKDASCPGTCDGSANIIPIGGTPPYSYSWSPGGYTDSTVTGLCPGTYNITITDASNCVRVTSLTINSPSSVQANLTSTDASCNGTCDGTATSNPTGGTAPYTFSWSNGSTTSTASNLCIGNHTVTVTDSNGCSVTDTVNISSPNALGLTVSITNADCYGTCNGSATANPTGGTAPYSYSWSNGQSSQTATGLCAGTYYIVDVTDANGCSARDTITVSEPSEINANLSTSNSTCGNCDGTASVAPSGGNGPYTVSWSNGSAGTSVSALCAGSYSVTITDNNGCSKTFPVNISDVGGPSLSMTSTDASCNGSCDGSASVTVTSGTAPYTYLWSPGGQTTGSINGLCAGTYQVQVTDNNGCSSVASVTITDGAPININSSVNDASCNGACDGSAIANPSGGVPPYSYNWSTGSTSNAVAGLCAGSYNVTVTDAVGCSNSTTVNINEPNSLSVTANGIDATCNNGCDGSATANPNGGTAPYTYNWSTGANTQNVTALCSGWYSVNVTDANGCSAIDSVFINQGSAITASISTTNANCGACDGSATVTPSGGSGSPFTYSWSPSGQTTQTANNLCPGAHLVTVTDNAGCTETFTVIISNPTGPSVTMSSDSVSCNGSCDGSASVTVNSGNPPYTYQWNDPALQTGDSATGLCAGLYSVSVKDNNGCITVDSITVPEPNPILANLSGTDPSCGSSCDGSIMANPTGGTAPYTYNWSPGGQVTQTINNLCAGTYTVTITDFNGCSMQDSITLTGPPALSVNITPTNVNCNGSCDGTALASASGGTGPYSYSWSNGQNNSLATNLCPGSYTVTVTDANGCIDSATVSITEPTQLTTGTAVTNASCNGVCDGSATTMPAGGTPPYSYTWSNGQTSASISNLCAGTYNVLIVDSNNCAAYDTITVTEPSPVNPNLSINEATCGVCDGDATANPTGGSGNFSYNWSNGDNTQTADSLCAGTYTLYITDNVSGCLDSFNVIINNVNGPNVNMTSVDESCSGSCDGQATATASGGTTPYQYQWNTTPVQNTPTATGLCAGSYQVTVTDSIGCITIDTITINTTTLAATIINNQDVSCFGDCDGQSTANPTSGTSPYSYSWNDPASQTTQTATGLCPGTYQVQITDSNGCSNSISTNINEPTILSVTASVDNHVSCNGACDGQASAAGSGGSGPYTYTWSPGGQTSATATNLCAGSYQVTVTDTNGCTATDSVTINEPSAIAANPSTVEPGCGVCNGSITVNPTGGTGPYTFLWAPGGQTTQTISNLCAGNYSITITDNTGCSQTFNIPLSNANAPQLSMSNTNASCFGVCDGTSTVNVSGGTPPYSYQWNDPSNQTTQTATGLCAGIYTVTITDSIGCTAVGVDTITEPVQMNSNVSVSRASCSSACDGQALVSVNGGTTPYSYQWNDPSSQTDSIATGLCAGSFVVTITDDNGCSKTDTAVITEPSPLVIDSTTKTNTTCNTSCDADASVYVSGGNGSYSYNWQPSGLTGQNVSGICFGDQTVTITDSAGCTITDTISIAANDTVLVDAGADTTACEGDTILLSASVSGNATTYQWFELPGMTALDTGLNITVTPGIGTTGYVFTASNGGVCSNSDTVFVTISAYPTVDAGDDVSVIEGNSVTLNGSSGAGTGGSHGWSPPNWLSDTASLSPISTPEQTITYVLTVVNEAGCLSSDSVTVTLIPKIEFPNGITPNGDGKNETWVIDFIDDYPNAVVEIYNRWGELLYRSTDYKNDWDGTYNGKPLPVGTYYYIIELNEEGTEPFTGPITIMR